MKATGFGFSVVGGREMNQDSFLINNEKGLYAVADGVGGGMKGEVASQMATAGLDELTTDPNALLAPIFHELQNRVYMFAMSQFDEPVMGTTLAAVRVKEAEATVVHAGDSRVYHITNGAMKQLTEDHELYDERMGGTVLASYLGIPADIHPLRVAETIVTLQGDDKLLICSDGLYRQLSETRVVEILSENSADLTLAARLMCEEAAQKEHSDNVTVVLIAIA